MTFWNERVGRVEPTREGQPLRWWYGPLKASPDPTRKWCDDCYGAVEEADDRRWCCLCKASQPMLDAAIEQRADEVTRELAPTWVRYPVGVGIADLRALIGQALSAALAGRTVVDTSDDGHCSKCGQPFSPDVRAAIVDEPVEDLPDITVQHPTHGLIRWSWREVRWVQVAAGSGVGDRP